MRARDNPFATDRIHAIRHRPQSISVTGLLTELKELGYGTAIVGPYGSGKTTLLDDLERVLAGEGIKSHMVVVNDTSPLPDPPCQRLLSELTRDELLLLDSADLVPRSGWSLLKGHTITHAYGLVITSHRPGLLPTLIGCTTSPSPAEHRPRAAAAGLPHLRRIPGHPLPTPPRQHPGLPP
ncbi:MAG: hypothetical protein ABFE01_25970 [Phycisphaerales bacterium]